MLNPYLIIGALVGAILLAGGGYLKGWSSASDHYLAASLKATHTKTVAKLNQANVQSSALEAGNAQDRIVYRTITRNVDRIVDRPVYRAECIDADGLRLINAAIAGRIADTIQPDGTMPRSGAAR